MKLHYWYIWSIWLFKLSNATFFNPLWCFIDFWYCTKTWYVTRVGKIFQHVTSTIYHQLSQDSNYHNVFYTDLITTTCDQICIHLVQNTIVHNFTIFVCLDYITWFVVSSIITSNYLCLLKVWETIYQRMTNDAWTTNYQIYWHGEKYVFNAIQCVL